MSPSNRHHPVLTSPLGSGVAVLLTLGFGLTASAQQQLVESLGRHTVGSKLAEVRSLQQSENCLIEGGYADCTFTDVDGVAYIVFEDAVTTAVVTEKDSGPGVKL